MMPHNSVLLLMSFAAALAVSCADPAPAPPPVVDAAVPITSSSASASAKPTPAPVDGKGYAPIPKRFHIPASEAYIEKIRASVNVAEQRDHAWRLFAGLTSKTTDGRAVFETWFSKNRTFAPEAKSDDSKKQSWPPFEGGTPRQARAAKGAHAGVSDIIYNRQGYEWIRKWKLYSKAELTRINDKWKPDTPWQERNVPQAPRAAVVLKAVYWPIRNDALTPMPIWDFDPENRVSPDTPQPTNPNTTWKRVVAVQPKGKPEKKSVEIAFNGKEYDAHVVPLNSFHHYKLDAAQAATLRNNVFFAASVELVFGPGREIRAGDHVALVALHAVTKEIPDWVWATIWWHDRPDSGPLALDRPADIEGPWRNYLMNATYDFNTPKEEDGSPNIAYNPWLEVVDPNGISSNCMSCHARASWPGVCSTVVTRGENNAFYNAQVFKTGEDPAYDGKRTHLDFMWSIYFESNPKIPADKPPPPCKEQQGN